MTVGLAARHPLAPLRLAVRPRGQLVIILCPFFRRQFRRPVAKGVEARPAGRIESRVEHRLEAWRLSGLGHGHEVRCGRRCRHGEQGEDEEGDGAHRASLGKRRARTTAWMIRNGGALCPQRRDSTHAGSCHLARSRTAPLFLIVGQKEGLRRFPCSVRRPLFCRGTRTCSARQGELFRPLLCWLRQANVSRNNPLPANGIMSRAIRHGGTEKIK